MPLLTPIHTTGVRSVQNGNPSGYPSWMGGSTPGSGGFTPQQGQGQGQGSLYSSRVQGGDPNDPNWQSSQYPTQQAGQGAGNGAGTGAGNLFTGSGLLDNLGLGAGGSGDPSNAYWNTGLNDKGGRYPANIAAERLSPAAYWNLANQYAFFNELQPQEHEAVRRYLNLMMNPSLMSDQFRQQQMGLIANQRPILQNALLSAGAGQGAKEGAALSLFNQGNRQANQFDANLYSPMGQGQRMNNIFTAYGSQAPNWNDFANIAQITNATPRNQSGLQAVGSLIGSVGSMIGGGGIPGLPGLGGGSGGGGGNRTPGSTNPS